MDIARTQRTPLQIAELVEHEQRVQALRLEMTVPSRSLLTPVQRALRTVHVEGDRLGRSPVMRRIDPAAGKIGECGEVFRAGQNLSLEATHGARRGRAMLHCPPADELAHDRIARQPVGVVDVLVSGETREDRLAQETSETMPAITAGARIGNQTGRYLGQTKCVVKFPMQQQAAVRTDRSAAKLDLHRAVELHPQRPQFRFTRRVRCQNRPRSRLTY